MDSRKLKTNKREQSTLSRWWYSWSTQVCEINDIVLTFADGILIDNQTFIQLGESGMILVLKKSDMRMPSNHWQIKLLFIVTKIINWMILHWIHLKNDPHLRPTQYGFRQTRPERSTTTRIISLRRFIEGMKERNIKATLIFIDCKMAFNSMHRRCLRFSEYNLHQLNNKANWTIIWRHESKGYITRRWSKTIWIISQCLTRWHSCSIHFCNYIWVCHEASNWQWYWEHRF